MERFNAMWGQGNSFKVEGLAEANHYASCPSICAAALKLFLKTHLKNNVIKNYKVFLKCEVFGFQLFAIVYVRL